MKAIRKVWDEVSDDLVEVIKIVTGVTGLIKALGHSPAATAILAAVDKDNKALPWLDNAIDTFTGVTDSIKSWDEKLEALLATAETEVDKNAILLKLAALASKEGDPQPNSKGESFYDSAVQLRIIADKNA